MIVDTVIPETLVCANCQAEKPLCFPCNVVLGHVCDDPDLLRGLVDYLREHTVS